MGANPVTRGQFAAFVANTGYITEREKSGEKDNWKHNGYFEQDDTHPAIFVSWNDAVAFTNWLSNKEHRRYRLPTEAEWEYACRAGTTTPFNTGATISTDQANYDGTHTYGAGVKGVMRSKTTPVGSFPANEWGLADMHGNVAQWCHDVFVPLQPYSADPATDPTGPPQDPKAPRVMRGGGWPQEPRSCRSAARFSFLPDFGGYSVGFRVVMDPP